VRDPEVIGARRKCGFAGAFTALAVNWPPPSPACVEAAMTRDPLREKSPPLPGEQRGKRDTEQMEDRGAGERPDELIPADAESPSRLPGQPPG